MVTEKEIIDVIADEMADKRSGENITSYKSGFFTKDKWIKSRSTLTTKKNLITEFEVRKIIVAGSKTLKISKNTIIGPLALEIIQEKGIKILRE
ncbi:MAG: hypothetical protein COS68_02725 [Elusimicrobia bacterium CG06_land_8_20_14_3_00_38_11]|nr:MAG: hypothetical protein COS68_02725 [Elusimicrobia bacterium CG06_land_8_20_14_3_00_38_11]